MATTPSPSATAMPSTLTVGACAPVEFPDADIRAILARGGHSLVFWHADPEAALAACEEDPIDLLLLGARRADPRSLECAGVLSEAYESMKVILICDRSGTGDVRKALDVGISALVPSSEVEDALLPVMEVVRAGQVSVPSSRGKELRRQVLTAREKQILGQVVLGMTNAEIAAKLFLAESTVKSHLSSAFAKLGVTSRNEAAALILDPTRGVGLGILTIPSEKVSAAV